MNAILKRVLARTLPESVLEPLRRLRQMSPRVLANRWRFRRWNRGSADDEMVLRPGIRLAIDPRSREPFEWFCYRSTEMGRELDLFLREGADRQRLLDVGACHGLFALAFNATRGDRSTLALEPSPIAYEILEANFARNFGGNLTPLRVAAGSENGELRMRAEWHHLRAVPRGTEDAEDVTVPLRTLDDLCAEQGFTPDLVKIDVEGYEASVLRGAQNVLRAGRPKLFLEIHPRDLALLGESPVQIYELLTGLRYRGSTLTGRRLDRSRFLQIETVSRTLWLPTELTPPVRS
jgi:FkbM family methyltransferase